MTTMEMQSTGVHTDAHNLRLSGVTHIESTPARRVRWASVASPVLRRAGLAGVQLLTPQAMTDQHPAPKRTQVRKAARVLFWILAGVIAILALYPRLTLPEPQVIQGVMPYLNHVLAFSVLMVVGTVGWGLRRSLVVGVTLGAIGLELAQTFSPGRQTAMTDMLASLAGVALGYALARFLPAVPREQLRPMTDLDLRVDNH